jgi:hypothetical protein
MKYRAVIKQSGGWWIGWLIDLPGVNAQERTREEVYRSIVHGDTPDALRLEALSIEAYTEEG